MATLFGTLLFFLGLFVIYSAFILQTQSSIHEIYQALIILIGVNLVCFGSLQMTISIFFNKCKKNFEEITKKEDKE